MNNTGIEPFIVLIIANNNIITESQMKIYTVIIKKRTSKGKQIN